MRIERGLCRVCLTRLAAEGFRTCDECGAQVRDALDDIVRLYPEVIDETLWPKPADLARSTPTYKSTPPIDLARLDRSRELGAADVVGALQWWADHVRESTGQARRDRVATVSSEVALLVKMWDWIRRQDPVDEFARELFALRSTLQRLAGQTRGRIRLGQCPAQVAVEGSAERVRCGQNLHARPGERVVRCSRCSTPWPVHRWDELAQAQEAG
jgi:hypothetical protein